MTDAMEQLVHFVREEVGYTGDLDSNIDLLDENILDSFSIVEIATFIQTNFDLELEAEDLTRENFSSLARMNDLISIRKKR